MMELSITEIPFMQNIKIANFEQYAISDTGIVTALRNNKPLHPIKVPNGYLHVTLHMEDGRCKQVGIHRLVAEHFIPNPYHYTQINHKDGNKENNNVSNLEWCTPKQNMQHALKNNLCKGKRYTSFEDRVKWVHEVLDGKTVKELANETGRRLETLHKMLRETAKTLNLFHLWQERNKQLRVEVALRNLEKANAANKAKRQIHH